MTAIESTNAGAIGKARVISFIILGLSLLPLSACGGIFESHKIALAGLAATQHGIFSRPDVNLKAKNYAAADFLAVQIQDHVTARDHIEVEPLTEQDNALASSEFGFKVPEGVALRLNDLGYSVVLDKVSSAQGQGYARHVKHHEHYTLKGVYAVKKKHIEVYLRVVNNKTDDIIGRFDYQLPLSPELKKMSKTPVQIFTVQPSSK